MGLRGVAVVEPQHAADPLTAPYRACSHQGGLWRDELVGQTLVWPFLMIVMHEGGNRRPEVRFAEWHDALQALGLDRADKPFGKRVQIWTSCRQAQGFCAAVP